MVSAKRPGCRTPHPLFLELGRTPRERQATYRGLIAESLGAEVVNKVRHCTNKGLILGTETFRRQFEQLTGDRAT
ncbi:MAG: hypothetical protein U5O39_12250 [Gammaproteobacteria bacterium]|nr:hypothetical protein [Gammaproteobacteria bacterium]